jgi:threonine dehydrogenase-like Zn-dependent dehydrogenase
VVIGIDRNEKRVQEIGNAKLVDHVLSISSHAPDILEQVTKITGRGVDVVIDCVGAENNQTLLSLYLHKIVAMPALEHLIIITILMVGEKGKT